MTRPTTRPRSQAARRAPALIVSVAIVAPLVVIGSSSSEPAHASSVTIDSCEVAVAFGNTDLTSLPEIGPPNEGPTHVAVSKEGNDCILQFLKPSNTFTVELPGSVTTLDALVLGGGGGGSFSGGGAGALFDTTQNNSSSGEVPLAVSDDNSNGAIDITVRVGAGGNGASPTYRKAGNGGDSWINPEGQDETRMNGGAGGVFRSLVDSWTAAKGGDFIANQRNGNASTSGYVLVRSDTSGDFRNAAHPLPDLYYGRSGGDASITNGCTGQERASGTGLFAVAGGGGGAGGQGSQGTGFNNCNVSPGNGGDGLASPIVGHTSARGGQVISSSVWYAGGGGGGTQTRNSGSPLQGSGGKGGGETARSATQNNGFAPRTTNTGGGGGGQALGNDDALSESAATSWSKTGGGGDSGIVILRYSVPSVSIDKSVSDVAFGESLQLLASDAGGGTLTWTANNDACTFNDSSSETPTVTPALDAGQSCVVTVSETGGSVADSTDSITISVVKAQQATLTMSSANTIGYLGSLGLTASGGSGEGTVTFNVSGTGCSLSDPTTLSVSALANKDATCTVSATKAESTNYNETTSADQTVTVVEATPVFDAYSAVSAQVGSADVVLNDPTLQVNGGAFSEGTISWSSANPTVADVTGSTLSFVGVGSTTLTATFTPTDSTNYDTVTLDVAVTVTAIPASGGGGDDEEEVVSPVPSATPAPVGGPGGVPGRPGPGVPPRGGDAGPGSAPPVPGGVPGVPVPPDRPAGTVGGQPVPTTTTASPGGRGVNVSAGGVDVGVDVPDPGNGAGGVVDRGGTPEPVVTPGQGKTIAGGGAAPGSVVEVWLPGRGTAGPTNIAQIPVGSDGSFSADVNVFGDDPLPIGRNVVQMVTTNAEGEQVVVDMPFTIAQGTPVPEVLRDTGDTPNAPVEGIVNTNQGDPTVTRVVTNAPQGLVTVESDGWAFTVGVDTQVSSVEGSDSDAVIRTTPNSQVTVTGSGFMPDTRVDVWAFSTPVLLGNAVVDQDGMVSVTVAITPQALEVGDHTLQLQAVGMDGFIRSSNLPVTVQEETASVTTRDSAGGLLWRTLGIVAAIAVLAVLTTLIIRRRQA